MHGSAYARSVGATCNSVARLPHLSAAANCRAGRSEQALIGSCLIDAGAFGKIPAQITPDNFSRPDHSKIWSTILELERQGKPHDAVIVAWELANAGEELEAGGVAYLIKIARDTLCANNVAIYAEHVRKGARANGRDRNAPQPFRRSSAWTKC